MSKNHSTPEKEARYKKALRAALRAGHDVLNGGGEAMDAAVAAASVMEDCLLFNSGKGAVFNIAGKNELESSIMLSRPPSSHPTIPSSRRGLSLTLLTRTRNPSHLARAMYLSPTLAPHATLSGPTAEEIGQESLGIELVDPSYFFTETRWREHRKGLGLPEEPLPPGHTPSRSTPVKNIDQMPTGTVGAVALDTRGCIAAVTSTGGKTNKLVGRIGDTPQMGSGFGLRSGRLTDGLEIFGIRFVGRAASKRWACPGLGTVIISSDSPRHRQLPAASSSYTSLYRRQRNMQSKIFVKMEELVESSPSTIKAMWLCK